MPCPGREKPHSSPLTSSSVRDRANVTLKSPRDRDALARFGEPVDVDERAQQLGVGEPLVRRIARRVEVGDDERPPAVGHAHDLANAPLLPPRDARRKPEPKPARLRAPEAPRVEDAHLLLAQLEARRGEHGIPLARERRAQDAGMDRRDRPPDPRSRRQRPDRRRVGERRHDRVAAPCGELRQRPRRELLQAHDVRRVGNREPHRSLEERAARRRLRVAVEEVPGSDEHRRTVRGCSVASASVR